MEQPVIVFDGVCNLCNRSVDFIIRRDPNVMFQFASNQSEAGEEILHQAGLSGAATNSIVLFEGAEASIHSTAVLRISRHLPMPWRLGYALIVIPAPVRDVAYRLLAKNRYRLFGRRDTCRLPTPEERSRFLE